MPFRCNGANSDSSFTDSDIVEEFQKRNLVANIKENSTVEAAFRGFAKVPAVLLKRYDITPYLPKKLQYSESKRNLNIKSDLINNKFLQKCFVNLVRCDLVKLRDEYLNSQDSDSCIDNSDPNMVRLICKICEKEYSSEKKLQNHQENKHMIIYRPQSDKPQKHVTFSDKVIVHEVKEYHKCRKCTKIFEDYKLLKIHMKQLHKKRKCYICNYCSKKFVDRTFFKVHIKLHCDICELLLPNKSKYVEHRRNICKVLKLYECKECYESFYRIMDLKEHTYEHTSSAFICDVCKDQFGTKCALAHHILFLHSINRPTSLYSMRNLGTERLYLCNFCEESSVERDVIDQHVLLLPDLNNKAMTGYKDYYFCDQCLQKFDTEMTMLKHKWTHFLKTSDHSQVRSNGILQTLLTPSKEKEVKTIYRIDEKLPDHMKPRVVLEKIKIGGKEIKDSIAFVDVNNFDVNNGQLKKAIVDPKSKKTLISNHQCPLCGKYYSSNYCLNRHIETQHNNFDYDKLQCRVCEETFVWPSLLQTHKCIRLKIPEMPFQDARPDVYFDNVNEITANGFDDINISESDDYMNSVDFEIPAPIVEFNEYDTTYIPNSGHHVSQIGGDKEYELPLQNLGYKVVMQEVPIEF